MPDNMPIADLQEDDDFIGFYVLKRCDLKEFDGGNRLDIELSDSSGAIAGVVWENAKELRNSIARGSVVKVKGRVGTYRDRPQVRIDKIRPAADNEYKADTFLPSTPKNTDELAAKVKSIVDSITEPYLLKLAHLIFDDQTVMKEYTRSPGGMQWHHPYLGGLLEHSVGVTEICDFVAHAHPELNRDLLVLAGLLHDIGKIREYTATTVIEYSDEGRLVGHIVMGERFVRAMCDRVEGFPSSLRMLLSHLMLSHQGHKEFSSPVEPMIAEGFVLYFADEMDSKLNAVGRIVGKAREENRTWSDYVKIINRFIYIDGNGEVDSGD